MEDSQKYGPPRARSARKEQLESLANPDSFDLLPEEEQPYISDDPTEKIDKSLLKERIDQVLQTLTYRAREVIKLRYGLGTDGTYTLEEVAKIFRTTRERIRQVEAKAVRDMQHPVRARKLDGFIDKPEPDIGPEEGEKVYRLEQHETTRADYDEDWAAREII
ncbi:MAG: sigma-70 family RNA polymerase sigma factor [archaeon]